MPITITFTNQDINEYDSFEEIKQISNFDLVFIDILYRSFIKTHYFT